MRISVLVNNLVALPSLEFLASQGLLAGLGIPDVEHEATLSVSAFANHHGIPLVQVSRDDLISALKRWLDETRPDAVWVITFPYKVPAAMLNLPRHGFFNFHPGLLPRYRGPDPIFWQIRNQEPRGGVSIHQMDAEFDSGPVVHVETLDILPRDTFGMHLNKLGFVIAQASRILVERLSAGAGELAPVPQDGARVAFYPRPQANDLLVDWATQPASAIDALTRASNPYHGGAITFWRGIPLRLLQVSEQNAGPNKPEAMPGTVVVANAKEGLLISSNDGKLLGLDIIRTEEGVFSGGRFAALAGVKPGEVLSSSPLVH